MLVLLAIHRDSGPPELGDSDVNLVNVRVLRGKESPNVQGELLRRENVRGGLGED